MSVLLAIVLVVVVIYILVGIKIFKDGGDLFTKRIIFIWLPVVIYLFWNKYIKPVPYGIPQWVR